MITHLGHLGRLAEALGGRVVVGHPLAHLLRLLGVDAEVQEGDGLVVLGLEVDVLDPGAAALVPDALRDGLQLVFPVGRLDLPEGGHVVLGDLRAHLGDDAGLPVVQDALLQDALLRLRKAHLGEKGQEVCGHV